MAASWEDKKDAAMDETTVVSMAATTAGTRDELRAVQKVARWVAEMAVSKVVRLVAEMAVSKVPSSVVWWVASRVE